MQMVVPAVGIVTLLEYRRRWQLRQWRFGLRWRHIGLVFRSQGNGILHLLVRTGLRLHPVIPWRSPIFRRWQGDRSGSGCSSRALPVDYLDIAIGLPRTGTVEAVAIGNTAARQATRLGTGRVGVTVGAGNARIGGYRDRRFHRAGKQHERTRGHRAYRSEDTKGQRCLNLAQIFLLLLPLANLLPLSISIRPSGSGIVRLCRP